MVLCPRFTGVFFVLIINGVCKLTAGVDKIRIRDVEVLTLYNGKMTNSRRTSPIPQLECVGGTAGCSAFTPHIVQCYNRGWDGYNVQWECKTEMDKAYRFGHVDVNCEGYDYPDDPYILRGSCGLKYTIELTGEGYGEQRSSGYDARGNNHHGHGYNRRSGHSLMFGDLVMIIIVGGIIYMIYSTCTGNRDRYTDAAPPPPYPEEPGFRREYTQGPSAQPPPYRPDEPGFKREYTQGSAPSPTYAEEPGFRREYTQGAAGTTGAFGNTGASSSGFWTGAATGGLLGYLFGRGTDSNRYYRDQYGYGWGSPYNSNPYYRGSGSWFGNWFGGGRSYGHHPSNHSYGFSSFRSSRSCSGSRTTSGMGGTSRR